MMGGVRRSVRIGAVAALLAMLMVTGTAMGADAEGGEQGVGGADPAQPIQEGEPTPQLNLVQVSLRLPSRAVRSCRGVARACTLSSLAGSRIHVTRMQAGGASRVLLQVRHRAPGARRLGAPRTVRARTNVPLRALVKQAGVTCVKVAPQVGRGSSMCVRWRPPVEIGWAGDIVVGSHYGLPPHGGMTQFARVAKLLQRPDLMIGNYEGTLSRGGASRCSGGPLCFIFQAPPERARNLRAAGFDVMTLANNHGLDKGPDARRQTVRALAAVGVGAAGLPGQVHVRRVADTRVAIVGMSPYPGTTNMRSLPAVRALVKTAKRRADVVVMTFHAGLEGPRGAHVPMGADYGTNTRAAVHAAVDAGADVVFGSGPHVVRGVERYRGAYIVYSSGNFAGWRNFRLGGLSSQSGVVRVTLDHRGRSVAAAWDGVIIDSPGIPRPDRSGRVVRRVASLSRHDFGARGARFTRSGRFR